MAAIENEHVYGLTIRESANDGSDFTNPDADYRRFFLGEDGSFHLKDSAGAVTDIGPATGIPATIFDAKGDLVAASAADTPARVPAASANGQVPTSDSSLTAGVGYKYPPGYEFDYVEFTSPVSITNTTRTTADTVVTGSSVAYDGSTTVMIEFFTIGSIPDTAAASRGLFYVLYEDGSAVGDRLAIHYNPAASTGAVPLHLFRRRTPASGSHTYSIRAYVTAGTGLVSAGDGTGTNDMPGFIRITRV